MAKAKASNETKHADIAKAKTMVSQAEVNLTAAKKVLEATKKVENATASKMKQLKLELAAAQNATQNAQKNVNIAKGKLSAASHKMSEKSKKANASAKYAKSMEKKLATAETILNVTVKGNATLQAAVKNTLDKYHLAERNYSNETKDVKLAKESLAKAEARLAKSRAPPPTAAPLLLTVALGPLWSLWV